MNKGIIYLFGRFQIIHSPYTGDKMSFVMKSLTANKSVIIGDFEWGIFDINELKLHDEYYIYGCLVKYKPIADEDIVDRDHHTFSKTHIPDKVIAKSSFILHPYSGVIAYHPVSSKISSNQFRNNFSRIIEEANDNLLVQVTVEAIDDETEIIAALKTFDKIHYISLELYPSNPNNRERWRRTDEKLRRMEIDKYKEYCESRKGIKLTEEEDIYGNILMAADGYGRATVGGIRDDLKAEVSTEKMPIKAEVYQDDTPKNLLTSLIDKFHEIWKRMDKSGD